jgi:hypothetical protein
MAQTSFTWKSVEITSFEQLFPALLTCEDQNELADFMNLAVLWSVEADRTREDIFRLGGESAVHLSELYKRAINGW